MKLRTSTILTSFNVGVIYGRHGKGTTKMPLRGVISHKRLRPPFPGRKGGGPNQYRQVVKACFSRSSKSSCINSKPLKMRI